MHNNILQQIDYRSEIYLYSTNSLIICYVCVLSVCTCILCLGKDVRFCVCVCVAANSIKYVTLCNLMKAHLQFSAHLQISHFLTCLYQCMLFSVNVKLFGRTA